VRAGTRADAPTPLAIGVANGVVAGSPDVAALATVLMLLDLEAVAVGGGDVEIDTRWLGDD
jgi:hypothetical protein